MSHPEIRTAPDPAQTGWPKGIPYIIGNEACERFSYYGMKNILFPHLTTLYVAASVMQDRAEELSTRDVHLFIAAVYATPMLGALIADKLLGKYRTILFLSMLYCVGHAILAVGERTLGGMHLGLACIALGAGGIKPCVSAHVGDQFGASNWHLVKKVFQIFYFAINFGSTFATLLIPILLVKVGAWLAFGLPGVLMFLATFVFWLGRHEFVHVPARPGGRLGGLDALGGAFLFAGTLGNLLFAGALPTAIRIAAGAASVLIGLGLFTLRQKRARDDGFLAVTLALIAGRARERFTPEAVDATKSVFKILSVFILVSIFWALFDQHSSTWIRQAGMMDRHIDLGFTSFTLIPAQTSAMNPILVVIMIPALILGVFPWLERRGVKITPLRRMTVGMIFAALSYVAVAVLQGKVDAAAAAGQPLHIAWQLVPYVILTLGEVLVSATGLEFAYSQAPARVKSVIMAFWNLTVSLGNFLVAYLAGLGKMPLERFFWLFAGLSAAAAVLFAIRAQFFTYRDVPQGE